MKKRISFGSHAGVRALLSCSAAVLMAAAGASHAAVPATTYHLYVSTSGSDSNTGSKSAPLRTITKAASLARASTTVHVAPGTYYETVKTRVAGTSSARIYFVSDTRWGAKIVGGGTEATWTNNGNYVNIIGFDVSGSGRLGILNWASYTSIENNKVHHMKVSGGCTGNGGAGIMNANYSGSDGDIIGNVVHDIGVPGACNGVQGIYHTNLRGKIMNNIVYRNSSYGVHLWHAPNNVTIANNTIFANGSSSMGGGMVLGAGDSPGGVVLDNTRVVNNLVYKNPRASIEEFCYSGYNCIGKNVTIANNLVSGNGSGISLKTGTHTGTITADPQFVSYNPTGTGDYRLKSTSPAINKGTSSYAPAFDIVNVARPKGGAFDIGAYENDSTTTTAPITQEPTPSPTPSPTSPAIPATTYHLYVAPTGSDSNSGTKSAPFKTITKAASLAKPSTTVHVAPGTYYETISTRVAGTSSARVYFVSDTRWGAKIIGGGTEATWTNNGNYVNIIGFDISGSGRLGILNWASYTSIENNKVHHMKVSGGCTGNGGAGIMNANYSGSDGDIIGNVVHDIGVPGACNQVQGIYHTNLRGKIMNNIVYRNSSYGVHLWHAPNNVTIANNTIFANGSSRMGGGMVLGAGDSPGGVVLDNTRVVNNLVYNNPRASIEEFCYSGQNCIGRNVTIANNLVSGNGSGISLKTGTHTGTVTADPQFVSYNPTGAGDYRLKSTSPAVNKGTSSSAPAFDIDNVARPKGGAFDIGAYESY